MPVLIDENTQPSPVKDGVQRKVCHLNDTMAVAVEFTDGPMTQPDPPHSHPHEQIAYVAEGAITLYLGKEQHRLKAGDFYLVPSNVEHTIQTHTEYVKLIDFFNPVREDLLE